MCNRIYGDERHGPRETIKRWSLASDPRTVADALAEFYRLDLREEIGRIQAPTLVLDVDWHSRPGREIWRRAPARVLRPDVFSSLRISAVHFALSDTARHFIMFDDPAWFFRQLDAFLADPVSVTSHRGLE